MKRNRFRSQSVGAKKLGIRGLAIDDSGIKQSPSHFFVSVKLRWTLAYFEDTDEESRVFLLRFR